MKNQKSLNLIIACLFIAFQMKSQVMINDSLFLQALIAQNVDTNQDGQIQFAEAEAVAELRVESFPITDFSGIEAFSNLTYLKIFRSLADTLDLTNNSKLVEVNLGDNELRAVHLNGLQQLSELSIRNNELDHLNLDGLTSLTEIDIENNHISNINLSQLTDLTKLDLDKNELDTIDLSNNPRITNLHLSNNNFTSIEVRHLKNLVALVLHGCPITTLDVMGLENLRSLWISKSSVRTLFMKGVEIYNAQLQFDGAPLKYICADEDDFFQIRDELNDERITDCQLTSLCPQTDQGISGGISGRVKIGQSAEDCDTSTNYLPYPIFDTEHLDRNGQHLGVLIGTEAGAYDINFYGTMTLKPKITYAPAWAYITPDYRKEIYSSNPRNYVYDFCMIPNVDRLKTQLNIIPLQEFRAGFESRVIVRVQNTGTLPFSGTLTLRLPKDSVSFISADIDPSLIEFENISWEIQNLLPFQDVSIKTVLRFNSPMDTPPLKGTENIQLCAELSDNDQHLNQICIDDAAVNSFDPNDKTHLGRDSMLIDQIPILSYLTYLIRFENTGTADAINIFISDTLDGISLLPSTIQIIDASHPVKLEMGNDDVAHFLFENIHLPFEEGINQGYVLFTLRHRRTLLSVDDVIKNNAAIYFDYNFPIITNEASIWITEKTVSINDVTNPDLSSIDIFPNPSKELLNLELKSSIPLQATIKDISGKSLISKQVSRGINQLDISELPAGTYFVEILDNKGNSQIKKIVKL